MDKDLLDLIDTMSDEKAMRLAVAVKRELDGGGGEAALAALSPEAARTFLSRVEQLAADGGGAQTSEEAGRRARDFLRALVALDVFNPIIAQKLVDAGVRLSVQDIAGWFSGEFNLASLVGIRFEYEGEKIEVVETEQGSIQKRRTIKLSIGTGGD